eukprot:1337552-Prymnesium_polylepis.1
MQRRRQRAGRHRVRRSPQHAAASGVEAYAAREERCMLDVEGPGTADGAPAYVGLFGRRLEFILRALSACLLRRLLTGCYTGLLRQEASRLWIKIALER